MEKLTIVTPTYNRAHLLGNCYDSLCGQSCMDFVWMVVDDGSADNTEEVVNQWIAENKIRILYLKKENGGKASALNLAIDHLTTEYAACLDSDDKFYPTTVETALSRLETVAENDSCCGILALRNNPDGSVMGGKEIPRDMPFVSAADIFLKLCLRTELICFYKTKILKNYRFPQFEGEKFVPPSWMHCEITQEYRFLTSWDSLCECEYVGDGLTKNKRKVIMKNPRGYSCVKKYYFDLAPNLSQLVKNGIMYDCGCILAHDKNAVKNARHKGWAVVLMPFGFFVRWTRFRRKS